MAADEEPLSGDAACRAIHLVMRCPDDDAHARGAARCGHSPEIPGGQSHFSRDVVGEASPANQTLNRGREVREHGGVAQDNRKFDGLEGRVEPIARAYHAQPPVKSDARGGEAFSRRSAALLGRKLFEDPFNFAVSNDRADWLPSQHGLLGRPCPHRSPMFRAVRAHILDPFWTRRSIALLTA
jgi:hypothetical protein